MRIAVLILLISSCWDGKVNGKKYKLEWHCTQSHLNYSIRLVPCGKMVVTQPYTYNVCDKGYYDTFWEIKK